MSKTFQITLEDEEVKILQHRVQMLHLIYDDGRLTNPEKADAVLEKIHKQIHSQQGGPDGDSD